MISGITLRGREVITAQFRGNKGSEIRPLKDASGAFKKFFENTKIMLDKWESRAIISVFCLSRRYSSIGRATDL